LLRSLCVCVRACVCVSVFITNPRVTHPSTRVGQAEWRGTAYTSIKLCTNHKAALSHPPTYKIIKHDARLLIRWQRLSKTQDYVCTRLLYLHHGPGAVIYVTTHQRLRWFRLIMAMWILETCQDC